MKYFSPKQVARAMGASEASLKRWCDRGLIEFRKTAGGHRRIPMQAVLDFIRNQNQVLSNPEALGLAPVEKSRTARLEDAKENIFESLIAGEENAARTLIKDLYIAGHPLHDIFDLVVAPAFFGIGCDWESGQVEVYQERRSCEICTRIIHEFNEFLENPAPDAPLALGGTLPNDPYTLPSMMIETVLRDMGWDARNLGINLPGKTLSRAIQDARPRMFWLSVSSIVDKEVFLNAYHEVLTACEQSGSWLIVGGRALTDEYRRQIGYTTFCDNLGHLVRFINDVAGGR